MLFEIDSTRRSPQECTGRPTEHGTQLGKSPAERAPRSAGAARPWWKRVTVATSCGLCLTLAAGVFALFKPNVWEAGQPLIVRCDPLEHKATETPQEQTRQNLQETLVTVFQSRTVLEATLRDVGPERTTSNSKSFPSLRDIESLRERLRIIPPSGSEFGQTDVVHLKVRARSPSRAISLVEAVVRHADEHLRSLHVRRARTTLEELGEAHHAAESRLRQDLEQLQKIEESLGLDSVTLRALEEKPDGGTLRASLDELDNKIQEGEGRRLAYQKLIEVLSEVQERPERLRSVPATLLEAHPALRRLQEALTDAEVKLIELQSHYAEEHPAVVAARMAVEDLRRRIAEEVPATLQTLHHEVALVGSQLEFLGEQRKEEASRLNRILAILPQYRELAARIRSETESLESVRRRLAEAQSALAAAHQTRWILPLEPVQTGSRPIGPGRLTILGAGVVCGLALALAVFLWLTPAATIPRTQEQSQPVHHPATISPELGENHPEDSSPAESPRAPQVGRLPRPTTAAVAVVSCANPSPLHQALLSTVELPPPFGEAVYER